MVASILTSLVLGAVALVLMHGTFATRRKVLAMMTGLGASLHRIMVRQQAEIGELRRENDRLWKAVRALAEGE